MGTVRCLSTLVGRVILVTALAVTASTLVAAPASAITEPIAGTPCGQDDLGRRGPDVTTFQIQPVITHFLAVHVANGSNTEQEYFMKVIDVVATEVLTEVSVQTEMINLVIFKASANAKISLKKTNSHTEETATRTLWRFINPGYYGLYSGVQKVTGTVNSLHCAPVTQPDGSTALRWVGRPAGTFTSFGADETGSVRCEERYPTGTVRDAARTSLCGSASSIADPAAAAEATNAAMALRGERALAAAKAAADARAAAAAPASTVAADLPASMTCDPGYSRFLTTDRQLAVGVDSESAATVALRAPGAGAVTEWRACHTTAQFPQYVLISRPTADGSPRCLDMGTSGVTERAPLLISPCTYRAAQRFTLYRDQSGATGIQSVGTGSMLGPVELEPFEGDGLAQFSIGRGDGLGTFHQEEVQ
jgi:hypothetical protein